MGQLFPLPPGYTLTVTAGDKSTGVRQVEDSLVNAAILPGFSQTFGPYLVARSFLVSGAATVSTAAFTASFGNMLVTNAGVPADAVQSTADVNPAGDDNSLTFTARVYGEAGDSITVSYLDPGAASQALSVSVAYGAIEVSLATDSEEAITSTAAEVLAAIDADPQANALVSVAIDASDTGVADDGSGVVTAMAATALASGAGFGIGQVLPGAICIDTTNSDLYRNDGTTAAPVWVKLGDAA